MDWRRAKTIFIISFILLDLFLAFQTYQMIEKKSQYLSTDKITEEQILDLLESRQIKMTVPMPDQVDDIPALQAQITSIPEWDFNEKWVYHQTLSPAIPVKDRAALQSILKKRLPFFDEYEYSKADSNQEQMVFLQKSRSHPIFDGKIVGKLKNGKLHQIRVLHFQIKEPVSIDFIPFQSALYNLIMRENLPKGAAITKVVLGYRSMYYPNPDEVILVPVWRLTVDKKHYYIYATTNNLNGEEQ